MIGNDGGGDKEMVRSSGGRSFQRRGAVMDMAQLENMRWEVIGGRERVKQDDDRVEGVGWMVKSSRRYMGWEDCWELHVRDRTLKWMRSGISSQ